MKLVPFEPGHVRGFELQPLQAYARELLESGDWVRDARQSGPLLSLLDGGGTVLGIGGAAKLWPGRAQAWAFLSRHVTARNMVAVHRLIAGRLDQWQRDPAFQRLEATVRCDFLAGLRWAELLGFTCEGWMKHYDPRDGCTHALFARVAHG